MAQLEKMTARQLDTWIRNLEDSMKVDEDPRNVDLYRRWLIEAREEKTRRWERKENYLKRSEKWKTYF